MQSLNRVFGGKDNERKERNVEDQSQNMKIVN